MPDFTGRYEYREAGPGRALDGACGVSFDEQTLTLIGGPAPIAFDLGDVDVLEAGEYDIRLALYGGATLRLTHFAKSFQDLRRQLLEAYRDRLVRCLLVSDLDEVARFEGRVHLESTSRGCEGPAQLRLYESNLAVLLDASAGFQWRLAEIEAVDFDEPEYAVAVRRRGERLVVGRLAKRTGELADRLRDRIAALGEREARVLHALFPFLPPESFRAVAGRFREGASVPIGALRPVHHLIESSLLERVVDGALRPYLHALAERSSGGDWHAGFKIVRKDAEPETGEAAISETALMEERPEDAVEECAASASEPDPALTQAGEGLEVLYWFFFPLRAASSGSASHVAWEATSTGGRATYVFQLPSPGKSVEHSVSALNDGLVALNFRREPVYLPADTLECEPRYRHYAIATRKVPELAAVRQAFIGRAIHRSTSAWRRQLDGLIGC